jgi:hypothetical protein
MKKSFFQTRLRKLQQTLDEGEPRETNSSISTSTTAAPPAAAKHSSPHHTYLPTYPTYLLHQPTYLPTASARFQYHGRTAGSLSLNQSKPYNRVHGYFQGLIDPAVFMNEP